MRYRNQIRIAVAKTYKEIDRVRHFFESSSIKDELQLPDSALLNTALDRDDWQVYYIRDHGEIIAAMLVSCDSRVPNTAEGQIRMIATDPGYRRQGLATELVKQTIKFALKQDILLMKMKAPIGEAVEFGNSCGFSTRYPASCVSGREALIMTRDTKRPFGFMPSDSLSETGSTTNDNVEEVRL